MTMLKLSTNHDYHVVPIQSTSGWKEHEASTGCWCKPIVEDRIPQGPGRVWLHHPVHTPLVGGTHQAARPTEGELAAKWLSARVTSNGLSFATVTSHSVSYGMSSPGAVLAPPAATVTAQWVPQPMVSNASGIQWGQAPTVPLGAARGVSDPGARELHVAIKRIAKLERDLEIVALNFGAAMHRLENISELLYGKPPAKTVAAGDAPKPPEPELGMLEKLRRIWTFMGPVSVDASVGDRTLLGVFIENRIRNREAWQSKHDEFVSELEAEKRTPTGRVIGALQRTLDRLYRFRDRVREAEDGGFGRDPLQDLGAGSLK